VGFDIYCWAHHYLIDPFQHFNHFQCWPAWRGNLAT
jgi:hypothetical protein